MTAPRFAAAAVSAMLIAVPLVHLPCIAAPLSNHDSLAVSLLHLAPRTQLTVTTRTRTAWSGPYIGQEARQPALVLESAQGPSTSPNLISIPLNDIEEIRSTTRSPRTASVLLITTAAIAIGFTLGNLSGDPANSGHGDTVVKDTRLTSALSGAFIGLSLGVPLGLLAGPRRTSERLLWRRDSGRVAEE